LPRNCAELADLKVAGALTQHNRKNRALAKNHRDLRCGARPPGEYIRATQDPASRAWVYLNPRDLLGFAQADRNGARFALTVTNTLRAAPYILRTGADMLSMGGFFGQALYPTLTQFKQYVASGQVGYVYLAASSGHGAYGSQDPAHGGEGRRQDSGQSTASQIEAWIPAVPASDYGGATTSSGSRTLHLCSGSEYAPMSPPRSGASASRLSGRCRERNSAPVPVNGSPAASAVRQTGFAGLGQVQRPGRGGRARSTRSCPAAASSAQAAPWARLLETGGAGMSRISEIPGPGAVIGQRQGHASTERIRTPLGPTRATRASGTTGLQDSSARESH
jgi:hypothetical protein